jgi:hypothetical protein
MGVGSQKLEVRSQDWKIGRLELWSIGVMRLPFTLIPLKIITDPKNHKNQSLVLGINSGAAKFRHYFF